MNMVNVLYFIIISSDILHCDKCSYSSLNRKVVSYKTIYRRKYPIVKRIAQCVSNLVVWSYYYFSFVRNASSIPGSDVNTCL